MSCPDIKSLPVLAEAPGLSIEEFMQEKGGKNHTTENPAAALLNTILKAVALAMGIAVVVLSVLEMLATKDAILLLGIGLACIAISTMRSKEGK